MMAARPSRLGRGSSAALPDERDGRVVPWTARAARAILGGAGERNQHLLYDFGRKLGIAFQVQDDFLDAFGDPGKFGKQVGGDILANKKTFLLIHVF